MHDAKVGDHVLWHVAGHDQAELAGPKTKAFECCRHCGDLGAVALPVKGLPLAITLPAEGGPIRPLLGRLTEDRADRLPRNSGVDVGPLGHHIHRSHSYSRSPRGFHCLGPKHHAAPGVVCHGGA